MNLNFSFMFMGSESFCKYFQSLSWFYFFPINFKSFCIILDIEAIGVKTIFYIFFMYISFLYEKFLFV